MTWLQSKSLVKQVRAFRTNRSAESNLDKLEVNKLHTSSQEIRPMTKTMFRAKEGGGKLLRRQQRKLVLEEDPRGALHFARMRLTQNCWDPIERLVDDQRTRFRRGIRGLSVILVDVSSGVPTGTGIMEDEYTLVGTAKRRNAGSA